MRCSEMGASAGRRRMCFNLDRIKLEPPNVTRLQNQQPIGNLPILDGPVYAAELGRENKSRPTISMR